MNCIGETNQGWQWLDLLREIVNQIYEYGNNDEWLRYMYVGEFLFNQRVVFLVSRK